MGTPECLRCEFMKAFLKTFPDETALLSPRCRAILIALAALARFDICRIECRHNVLRKFAQLANTGWSPELQELSAKFMCSRGSKLQHCFSTDKAPPPWKRHKKVPGPRIRMYQKRLVVRKNGMKPNPSYQRVGGGGAHLVVLPSPGNSSETCLRSFSHTSCSTCLVSFLGSAIREALLA